MKVDDRIAKVADIMQTLTDELMHLPTWDSVEQSIDTCVPDVKIDCYFWDLDDIEDVKSSILRDLLDKVMADHDDDPFEEIAFNPKDSVDNFKLRVLVAKLIRAHDEWVELYFGLTTQEAIDLPLPPAKI